MDGRATFAHPRPTDRRTRAVLEGPVRALDGHPTHFSAGVGFSGSFGGNTKGQLT
jgi:hypothetical protein